jgi:hypothetical protein
VSPRVQKQAVEGNNPHGGHGRIHEGDMVHIRVSHGIAEVKLLCFRWLNPFLNSLNAELNPIFHLLALLGGATIVVVSRLRVKIV